MPSFTVNEKNIVVAAMSFEPVSAAQHHVANYDTSIVGKLYENGEFHDVEPLQNDSAVTVNDGGFVDE